MFVKRLVLSVPLTIGWTIYTGQINIGNILLGWLLSLAVVHAIGVKGNNFNTKNLAVQVGAAVIYVLTLALEILKSGLNVARITLDPNLPINPGIAHISTQDETHNPAISAISAHGITITPGELVIDFEETEDDVKMIVHSLSIDKSSATLDSDQTKRITLIKRILGYD